MCKETNSKLDEVYNEIGADVWAEKPMHIYISATFTASPLIDEFENWKKRYGYNFIPQILSYNQLFQDLLDKDGRFRNNENGLNVIMFRFEDWLPYKDDYCDEYETIPRDSDKWEQLKHKLYEILNDFISALQSYNNKIPCYTVILICPVSEKFQNSKHWKKLFNELDAYFNEQVKTLNLLIIVRAKEFHDIYHIEDVDDPLKNKVAHIPFVNNYYAFLATLIVRVYHWVGRKQFKVIVLDCDNTLWKGVCGETIPQKLIIDSFLQNFLVKQMKIGMLLCLCSKNDERDVWNVFEKRSDMPLKREYITDFRINWESKSKNLYSLSESLNLNIDSFIFIDDNPVECAEVKSHCPSVMVLEWPSSEEKRKDFINHTWLFDTFGITTEDAGRTVMTQQNLQRNSFLKQCSDFTDFLKKLNLKVDIKNIEDKNVDRVSQLTKRTNQFNFTTIRRNPGKIKHILESNKYECRTVHVTDRFGEYGLVGVIIFQQHKNELVVDSFVLSCRVLGRGVEHEMIKELGRIAFSRKCDYVDVFFIETEKNKPAQNFLNQIASQMTKNVKIQRTENNQTYRFKANILKDLTFIQPTSPPSQVQFSRVLKDVKKVFSSVLSMEIDTIDITANLENYIKDSLKVVEITVELQKKFSYISSTFLYENSSIEEVVRKISSTIGTIASPGNDIKPHSPILNGSNKYRPPKNHNRTKSSFEVAIIGVNGRFPQALSIEQFWQNLLQGSLCISEIPQNRWDAEFYYDPTGRSEDKSHSKWGGFIDEVDCFDNEFFNISPKEAELMDPQQRIFLEVVWGLLEDAGYIRNSISNNTGVFVGVISNDYNIYSSQEALSGMSSYRASEMYQIPNRISYFMNLHGPSIAIDTACSGSGTAIHLAYESLKRGECHYAIVGGVNLFLHPSRYIQYSQMKMLSKKNKCCPFGADADGTIFGEGIGALLLKPSDQARKNRDNIYAIIKGTAINSGGKTNGFTVPNPISQTDLITQALENSHVSPRTISYVEAHGTATPLGDTIEFQGLTEAFKKNDFSYFHQNDNQYCALGSVKGNIGHLESGAGVAAVIKTILQMKNKVLVPSLNASVANPLIPFKSSPFFIPQKMTSWQQPVLKNENGDDCVIPRRAGISSFGAGGANAHIILEEFTDYESDEIKSNFYIPIIVLSAKSEEILKKMAYNLKCFVEKNVSRNEMLANIAYSLQTGREQFAYRLAIICGSMNNLMSNLDIYLRGYSINDAIFYGVVRDDSSQRFNFGNTELDYRFICGLFEAKEYAKVSMLWVFGADIPWDCYYRDKHPQKISLPTYPFKRERYWLPNVKTQATNSSLIYSYNHPLLQENTSNLYQQRFSSVFTGKEFFLKDHLIQNQHVLPGMAYLEMARLAVEKALEMTEKESTKIKLRNIIWVRPIIATEKTDHIHICLSPENEQQIAYKIYSQNKNKVSNNGNDQDSTIIHSQGIAVLSDINDCPIMDLSALQSECKKTTIQSEQIYKIFKAMSVEYGPAHQGVEQVYIGENQVLAKILLPASVIDSSSQYFLHPSLLDSAIQSSIFLLIEMEAMTDLTSLRPFLPFALEEVVIYRSCALSMWSLIRPSDLGKRDERMTKLDINIMDDHGNVCISLKGLTYRMLSHLLDATERKTDIATLLLKPYWHKIDKEASFCSSFSRRIVILCEQNKELLQYIASSIKDVQCLFLQSENKDIGERFKIYACKIFNEIQKNINSQLHSELLIQIIITGHREQGLFSGLLGLLKTAEIENPKLKTQLIEIEPEVVPKTVVEQLQKGGHYLQTHHIRYHKGCCYGALLKEVKTTPMLSFTPWKEGGVYLITGGTGGLGIIFAKEIVQKAKNITVVLAGRHKLSDEKEKQLQEHAKNARIVYRQVDVTKYETVSHLITCICKEFGALHGIIHAAGVIKDNFIMKKNDEELQMVLAPKITGVLNLDYATKDLPLDLFVLFSSTSALFVNPGQADYATANAFMDAYAKYRNSLVVLKKRKGKTLSINWPLWKEGGMHVNKEIEKMNREKMGIIAMNTTAGIRAFYQSISLNQDQVIVLRGEISKIKKELLSLTIPSILEKQDQEKILEPQTSLKDDTTLEVSENILKDKTVHCFKKLLSSVIKLPANKIEADTPMEKYGIDSIMIMKLTDQLEKMFGSLSKTLFFEYKNISELAQYFIKFYHSKLIEILQIENNTNKKDPETSLKMTQSINLLKKNSRSSRFVSYSVESQKEKVKKELNIAIIGIAGRYPQSRSIEEFWENLRSGKDCISEIPKERWDYNLYFDEDKEKIGKSYSKWGGFIDGVDQFDPRFFNISPRESEIIDPQERLFLQCAYEVIEDAGYTRETLCQNSISEVERNIGVYVGVMWGEYQLYGAQEQILGRPVSLWGNLASIANRVSYFGNFHGPCMVIDTMCSSSLTAIHLACQSLQRGECDVAIAGGVNVSIHPNKYLFLSQGKFVSSKGRCESFGQGGDGYVPGEGVGAVLLKPLSKAIADRDQVYGIIKGTAINHGGKNNGYTVPNPNAQARVIRRAFTEAGINPRTISYIEAHGSGTSLGDPIEIAGLDKAFKTFSDDKQFCAIGSAKSNIGHCESAAGIAGVTKILLQLKHRQLVPSLHSRILNQNIDFKNTPFIVQQKLTEWKRPMIGENGELKEYPRIAGISSFGAGGSNAHMVIEEYIQKNLEINTAITTMQKPVIIVLSAKNEERLKEQIQQLVIAIKKENITDSNIVDLAYTLQVGREAMEERLAVIVGTIKELAEKLKAFIDDYDDIDDLYRGRVKSHKETMKIFIDDEELHEAIEKWLQRRKYAKLMKLWVNGLIFDWNKLYGEIKPRRISLPTYPFARERYWVSISTPQTVNNETVAKSPGTIHPLLHENTSDFLEQRFSTIFTNKDSFFTFQVNNEQRTVYEAAHLEMAQAAAVLASRNLHPESTQIQMKNITWSNSISIKKDPVQVHIHLFPEENDEISYEIYNKTQKITAEPLVYSYGSILFDSPEIIPPLDIIRLKEECEEKNISSYQVHEMLKSMTIDYEIFNRGIEKLYIGKDQALVKFILPSVDNYVASQLILHPHLIDPIIYTLTALIMNNDNNVSFLPLRPDSMKKIKIFKSTINALWGIVRINGNQNDSKKLSEVEVDICDELGDVCICIKGLNFQQFQYRPAHTADSHKSTMLNRSDKLHKPHKISLQPLADEQIVSIKQTDQSPPPKNVPSSNMSILQTTIVKKPEEESYTQQAFSKKSLSDELITTLAEALYMKPDEIDIDEKFVDMGLDSIIGVEWVKVINKRYDMTIPATMIYDYPSVREFCEFLTKELNKLKKELVR